MSGRAADLGNVAGKPVAVRHRLGRGGAGLRVSPLLLLPALLAYGAVVLYPSIAGAFYAFTNWDGLAQTWSYVGLKNFHTFVHDEEAVASLRNTLLLAVTITIVQNAIGLLLALGLTANIKSKNLLRTIFFAPALLTPAVIAYLWQYVYGTRGALNTVLGKLGLEQLQRGWLGETSLALWAIAGVVIWQYAGYSMVIFVAGLQNVPDEFYEAAELDGAGAIRRFWNISWPLIAPATTINLLLSIIGGLKLFDQIYVMTKGGPGYATETMSTIIYKQAFEFGRFGYSTAIALMLAMIVAAVALFQLSLLRRREMEA